MLTLRTAAHLPTNRHRASFRDCPASTGAPQEHGRPAGWESGFGC